MIRLASRACVHGGGRRLRRQPAPVGVEGGDGGVEAGPVADQADLRSTSASRTRGDRRRAAVAGGAAGGWPRRHQPRAEAGRPRAGRGLDHRLPGPAAEDEPLEQRVAGQAVGAVDAGAGDLAGGEQPGHRRPAVEVGLDAAHHVVRGRAHRHRIARQVEPGGAAGLGDVREAGVHHRRVEMLQRQEHRPAGAGQLADDAARHAIARRQIAGRLVARHERLAVGVDQPGAFAAQRLRQQEARLALDLRAPSGGTARTRGRRRARRPPRPSRCRRRTPPRGWSSRGTPGRRRRSRAASPGPAPSAARRPDRGSRRRRRGRPRSAIAVARACSTAWMRGCAEVRAHSVPPISRPVVSRACSTRRTLCAASRASATSPFGWRSKAAPQSISS